ncbi:unnamed protein product [Orchesella dallaii]|uniref:BED-type domain-containing protein n=1 Tax=Orchesella dallaii TaxID=48710 RepID=A0ABP1QXD5_9HEXA
MLACTTMIIFSILGKKFEAFRSKYSSETDTNTTDAFASSSTSSGGPSSLHRKTKESKVKSFEVSRSRVADDEHKQECNKAPVLNMVITEAKAKNENKDHSDSDNESNNDMDLDEVECDGEPSDSDAPCGDKDEDGYDDDNSKGNLCWSKFLMGTDLHGKRTATCNACHTVYSSPRVHRLIGHLKRCSRGNDNRKKHYSRKDAYKKSKFAQDIPGNLDDGPKVSKKGRQMKQAWLYFNLSEAEDGKRVATCKWCGHFYAAPKVERLITHLEKCDSLGLPKQEVPSNEENPVDDQNDLCGSGNEPEDFGSCFSSDGEYSDDDIAIEAKSLKDPLETESEKKGGRKKMKIWKYFETVKVRNGKFSARCHLCSNLVSARAPRMVEHRIKCSRMSESQRAGVKKRRPRRKGVDSTVKRLKQEESDNDNSSSNINNTEDTVEKEPFAIETTGEHSSSQKTTIGRHLDLIWAYFTIVQMDNLKKAKCIACGQIVSPKAGRMRIHKSVCPEISTAETHSSSSLLASGDDSNNNS